MQNARVILLPGLSGDPRLLAPQAQAFPESVETPAWIAPEPGESLERYARRWAKQLRREDDPRPTFVGGVSFGGVLAMHMAEVLQPEAVILIASCRSSDDVPLRYELAAKLGMSLPAGAIRKLLPFAAAVFALREGLDADHFSLLRSIARDADAEMLRWAARAVADWSFTESDRLPCPVYRVHGRHDWVIPLRDDPDAHRLHARHLISLTMDRSVNDFLRGVVANHGAQLPTTASRPPARVDRPTYMTASA
ncbi:MAG: alpha/beta fold hydrolase [Phycisphaeraceae bacterium]